MGLTRITAEQISDIDYKQAVRVVTLTNISLGGSAPSIVDGVTLATNDRVLVNGQSTGSQNGLYQVVSPGTGSDGIWVRSGDGNTTGEIQAGMIVMVTEGTVYKDTQWKLVTNNPIIINTTSLTFELNASSGTAISNGTSNVAISTANGNVTIGISGTSNVVTVSQTSLFVNGVIATPRILPSNIAVPANSSAMMVSPLTIPDGLVITVPDSSTFNVVP